MNRLTTLRGLVSTPPCDYDKIRKLRRELVREFMKLNGWYVTECSFGLDALADGKKYVKYSELLPRCPNPWEGVNWDHTMYFRHSKSGGKTAALVTQPYGHREKFDYENINRPSHKPWKASIEWYKLKAHMPPNQFASVWFPGSTAFVVLTRPDVEVKWLPEQLEYSREDF